jgi:hypothetical protein
MFSGRRREVAGILKKKRCDTSAIGRTEKGSQGLRYAED